MGNINSSSSLYFPFVVNLYMMTFFQLISVLVIIYRQANADVFLIDWESSRSQAGNKEVNTAGVSVWRSILIANEWNEMQTKRKTDIRFTLFFMGLVLIGSNLQYDATQQPILSDKSEGDANIVLRFASSCWWWLLFSLGQVLWKHLIYERYITELPAQQFVDLCTIAKISIIVLDEQYHGYYLHCRSPHQFADGTMTELVEMLHREEAGLTVDRSLDGAPADVQSFEIFLASEWRSNYEKIYNNLNPPSNAIRGIDIPFSNSGKLGGAAATGAGVGGSSSQRRAGGGGGGGWMQVNSLPPERALKAWREMNVFLKEFIDNNFGVPGLRRVVREQTYLEKLMHFPPFLSIASQPSVFFPDRNYNYTKVLFLGQEANLLLMNILTYSLFDLWFGSAATSMLLCYLVDNALSRLRRYLGKVIHAFIYYKYFFNDIKCCSF